MEKAAQHLSVILQEEMMTLAQQFHLEGRREGKLEIAQRLLAKHMPIEMISEITSLSKQHIQALRDER